MINYTTLRRLIGHLHVVADQSDKNLMPVFNLAPLWGPNMMTVDGGISLKSAGADVGFSQSNKEMEVFQAVGNASTLVRTLDTNILYFIKYCVIASLLKPQITFDCTYIILYSTYPGNPYMNSAIKLYRDTIPSI